MFRRILVSLAILVSSLLLGAGCPSYVTILSPEDGATVTSPRKVTAEASGNVVRATLRVDGQVHSTDQTKPFSWDLDTSSLSTGSHRLQVDGFDADNQLAGSDAISISVQGSAAPIPPSIAGLEIHVINVGQADAILIRCPERPASHEMLIDAGDTRYPDSSKNFKAYLQKVQPKSNPIEVVVASHPHADHIGNMKWVIDTYKVGLYVDNGQEYDSATYQKLRAAYQAKQVPHRTAAETGVNVDFCPLQSLQAEILRPANFDTDPNVNANDRSVIVRITHGSRSFLFVGDCEEEEEHLLLNDPAIRPKLDCDFLKAGHHGSNTSSTPTFLQAVTPSIVAVSCGEKDKGTNKGYNHPRQAQLQSFLAFAGPRDGAAVTIDTYVTATKAWSTVNLDRAVYTTSEAADNKGNHLFFASDGTTIRRVATFAAVAP